ncbi:PAS domain-containing sensor histidine kinase [Dyadobacter sandarakinus]|uniref:histidine kinase n=1 Tax=Dyadobacter sandarakinus TaxID=2747268 RepID=A0ABX7I4S7_9BACT|nr:ATP-binding protein [Dyadobacter sandarakinus]QRR01111.1 PAS domain-containing protein [Dyadobacter sandarakinus]
MDNESGRIVQLKQSEAFLQSILNTTSNYIASYEAIRTGSGVIEDFRITYTNLDVILRGMPCVENLIGRTCRETNPEIFENGIFQRLVQCVETKQADSFRVSNIRNGQEYWYEATVEKLNDGVTVTSRDVTGAIETERKLQELNRRLKIQNSLFNHSEENAHIGSFAWNLDTNELECSDNLFRLVGHEPGDFTASFERFLSFVHPDDRHQAIRDGFRAYESKGFTKNTFRVITKTGTIRFIRLSGNFIREDAHHIMIGALQDVTNDVQLNEALNRKNKELKTNNEELASFSYVASHDLQEPLRKIRAFSSRILEKEQHQFSNLTRDYFSRIISAATRMQNLIEALLNYSRTNTSAMDFKMTDLNQVLEDVKSMLEGQIEEKKAIIEIDSLPEIPVIPVQFAQLMQNLISNSLKYSKAGEPPFIRVHWDEVEEPGQVRYHRISVEDNGIGFEQHYEDRIFELFQRLHGRGEYEGTGLGLAICKKIAANHEGFIRARGVPGAGATFSVYLPFKNQPV